MSVPEQFSLYRVRPSTGWTALITRKLTTPLVINVNRKFLDDFVDGDIALVLHPEGGVAWSYPVSVETTKRVVNL